MKPSDAFDAANDILTLPKTDFYTKYSLPDDVRDWRYEWAKEDIQQSGPSPDCVNKIYYRLFDRRHIYYTGRARGFVGWPTTRVMRHMTDRSNIALCFNRTTEGSRDFADIFVVDGMIQHHTSSIKEVNYLAPLYLRGDGRQSDAFQVDTLNLDPKLYTAICAAAGIDPADQAGPDDDFRAATGDARPSEVKVFDYIYGVLHSPDYRRTFAEFLKIDFPRIPYPPGPEVFARISEQGEALRRLHLMEPAAIGDTPYPYHGEGDDVVASGYPKLENGRIHINPHQYFDAVPAVAWTFPIGGYLPAQKWLKDRRGRALSWDDIGHYQKVLKILAETDRIMQHIDLPLAAADPTL